MRVKKFLNNVEGYISSIMLAIMLVVLFAQVILRSFGASNSWSEELSRYLFVWIVYLGGSMAAASGEHIKIEALTKIWPKKIRPVIMTIGSLIWIVFSIFIIYYGTILTINLFKVGTISMGLRVNLGWAYAAVPVGYLCMVIRIIQCMLIPQIKSIASIFRGENTTDGKDGKIQ